jgi:diguanylate cyclase (GGDEF)-like protein/PAS domain S-box-containing protein
MQDGCILPLSANSSADELRQQLEALTQFVYLAPIGIIQFAADGRVDLINPMAAQLVDPMALRDLSDAYAALAPIAQDLAAQVAEFQPDAGVLLKSRRAEIPTPDGSLLAVSLTVQRVSQTTYMAVVRDITHIVVQERLLFQDAQRFRAIIDGVRDYAIYVMDCEGRLTAWNRSIERIGGWHKGDVEARHIRDFFLSDDAAPIRVDSLLAVARRDGSAEAEGWRRRRDGSRFWASTTFTALKDDKEEVWAIVGISRDLTERKRMEDELRVLATTDPLTGAFNRRHGHARLAEELQKRDRYRTPVSVLLVDIDYFKSINDRFGHEVGDSALRALAACCANTLRVVDIFVRWGGEEFLAILTGTTEGAAADAAERIRAAAAAIRIVLDDGTPIGFTVSIGVAEAQDASITCLVSRADTALYAAKRAGRDRVILAGQDPPITVALLG